MVEFYVDIRVVSKTVFVHRPLSRWTAVSRDNRYFLLISSPSFIASLLPLANTQKLTANASAPVRFARIQHLHTLLKQQ